MGNLLARLLACCLAYFFLIGGALAVERVPVQTGQYPPIAYKWGTTYGEKIWDSPEAACQSWSRPEYTYVRTDVDMSGPRAACYFRFRDQNPTLSVWRYGTGICNGTDVWSSGGAMQCQGKYCPTGYTMDPDGTTCSKPDEDPCLKKSGEVKTGWYIVSGQTPPANGAYCDGQCKVMLQLDPSQRDYYTNYKQSRFKMQEIQMGAKCNGEPGAPVPSTAAESPPEPPKKPPCAATEGVLTSSSGAVHCVPSGVPDAAKPVVEKQKSSETFPDGSGKTTETTTIKDPSTGATSTSTTTTTTAGPGGGTQAGPPGTTSGESSKGKDSKDDEGETSKFCKENPKSLMCVNHTFAGSCDAEPTCEGDAAVCAIAKATWETKCVFREDDTAKLADKENPGGTLEQQAAAEKALNKDGDSDFDLAAKFAEYNRVWVGFSSSCPAGSETFTIGVAKFTLDWSFLCAIGAFIRLLVHAVAYLAVARLFAVKLF